MDVEDLLDGTARLLKGAHRDPRESFVERILSGIEPPGKYTAVTLPAAAKGQAAIRQRSDLPTA